LNTRDGHFKCGLVGPLRVQPALAVAAGDYDNDGDLDLYVMSGGQNVLLENDGRAHFVDVTDQCHVAGNAGFPTTTGTFFDVDGDGRLDLYLGHGDSGLESGAPLPEVLRQNPDHTFSDVTMQSGLAVPKNTLSMLAFDYDNDMRQDVIVTGNFALVSLFHNDGNGHFSDVTTNQPMGFQTAVVEGMGLDIADFDGDGDFDIYASNSLNNPDNLGSGFFVNQGNGTFASMAAQYGVLASFDWGTSWADFDNDGWPDPLTVGNSAVSRALYRNVAGQRFERQMLPSYPDGPVLPCVTSALADYDRDGRVDIILARLDGTPPELLHNETAATHNWLSISLAGKTQRDPIGALVEVTAAGRVLKRQLLAQTSKGTQSERLLQVGVGDAKLVDITVHWPLGGTNHLSNVPVNRIVAFDEGCTVSGSSYPAKCAQPGKHGGCAVGRGPSGRNAPAGPLFVLALVGLASAFRTRRRARFHG
jgi:hypothetical protein